MILKLSLDLCCVMMQVACQNLGPLEKGGAVVGIDTKVINFNERSRK